MKKMLADFQPLKLAEEKLLECCQNGEEAYIGEKRPTEKTKANEIRAEFLRWLILSKEIEIDPNGIQFEGAWISGVLDLENVHCLSVLSFLNSVFEEKLFFLRSLIKALHLSGSFLRKGLVCDGMICKGNIHLRRILSDDTIRLLGAEISGNLDCDFGSFKSANKEEQSALLCDGIKISGSTLFRDSICEGEVRFLGATIGGNLECDRSRFKAKDQEHKAIDCDGMQIKGGLFLRNECFVYGGIELGAAIVGSLVDDRYFWQQETLRAAQLDGFKYEHIYTDDITASFHLKNMLVKMPIFKPQPYRQLAKVLRDMGHDRDADEVMIALNDKRLSAQIKVSFQIKINNLKKEFIVFYLIRIIGALISYVFRKVYKWTSAYGYRPMRAFGVMLFVWLLCGLIYDYSAKRAVFVPTNPLIYKPIYQDQPQETNCTLDANGTPWFASVEDYNTSKNNWYYATHAEYTTFQPYWYSLDIILPIVDLKMENDWSVAIPSPDGSFFKTYNYFVRSLVWIESLIGWGLSLMLAAILDRKSVV